MRSSKFRGTPKPDWMIDRQVELLIKFAFVACYIAFISFLIGYSMLMDSIEASAEEVYTDISSYSAEYSGLYAGALQVFNEAEKEPICTTERSEKGIETSSIVEIEEEEVPKWSDDDYNRLAHLVYAEAGNQGYDCMMMVGSVVLNRIASERYPNTMKAVINQRGQYSVKGYYMSLKPSDDAYYVAEELLENGSILPDYVLYQHGNNRAVKGTKIYKRLNGEVFSYEERDKK